MFLLKFSGFGPAWVALTTVSLSVTAILRRVAAVESRTAVIRDDASLWSMQNCLGLEVRKLDLSKWPRLTDDGVAALSPLAGSLVELNLSNCLLVTQKGVETLNKIRCLQRLLLVGCIGLASPPTNTRPQGYPSRPVEVLNPASDSFALAGSLIALDFSNCTSLNYRTREWVSTLTSLEALSLNDVFGVTTEGLLCFAALPRLIKLMLARDTTDDGLRALTPLRGSLKSLNLYGLKSITAEGLASIANLTSLTQLVATRCSGVCDESLVLLSESRHVRANMRVFHARDCVGVTGQGLRELSKWAGLEILDLSSCGRITDAGLENISQLHKLTTLLLANVSLITDIGLVSLSGIVALTSLDLARNSNITDKGLESLSQLPVLSSLRLPCCTKVTDLGLQSLTRNAGTLTTLNVSHNTNFTQAGMRHLAQLSALQDLSLMSCWNLKVEDVALFTPPPRLRYLAIEGCTHLTPDFVARLRSEHPSLSVRF
jgi:hypothetical protein